MLCRLPAIVVKLAVALTVVPLTVTLQEVAVPVQAPLQPANEDPLAAAAVNVTWLLVGKSNVQVPGQAMPDGLLVTVPLPVPVVVTVSRKFPLGMGTTPTQPLHITTKTVVQTSAHNRPRIDHPFRARTWMKAVQIWLVC